MREKEDLSYINWKERELLSLSFLAIISLFREESEASMTEEPVS